MKIIIFKMINLYIEILQSDVIPIGHYNFRDKNFHGVGPVLSRKAKVISSQFDERHGDKSVQEIKQFVARLPHMLATKQSLAKRMHVLFH